MKKPIVLLSALFLAVASFSTAVAFEGRKAGDVRTEGDITVKGEILDMACYVGHGAKGADHAACALRCAKSGQPVGLLADDGTVYILYADHKDSTAFDQAKNLAGKKVSVSGRKASQGSMNGIEVHSVKAL